MKRPNFYPNGEMIDFRLPQDFRKSVGGKACGNCGQYSNKRSFCNIYKSFGVKMFMFAISGDRDFLIDNGYYFIHRWSLHFSPCYKANVIGYSFIY